jgi:cyclic pyranopterin phosphate synthase
VSAADAANPVKVARPASREFTLLSINISTAVGVPKTPVDRAVLRDGHGIEGDAHAGEWHRQVSLLADEDIETMRGRGVDLPPGIFAENLTTRGIDLSSLPVGALLRIGPVLLEITQIGKECHQGCAIRQAVGDCVMPRRGVFARVLEGGEISRESRCRHDL